LIFIAAAPAGGYGLIMVTELGKNGLGKPTVGDAVAQMPFGKDHFFAPESSSKWWYFRVLGVKIYCYNFNWRKRALFTHDLHHVVTGYPCTMKGEMQVATWEFAAGRFPNVFSNLFCLPLVAAGTLLIPRKTFKAFQSGQQSRSLFAFDIGQDVRDWPLEKLKALTVQNHTKYPFISQILAFAALSGLSFLLVALPLAAILYLLLRLWN
jgi:hypothetical protein